MDLLARKSFICLLTLGWGAGCASPDAVEPFDESEAELEAAPEPFRSSTSGTIGCPADRQIAHMQLGVSGCPNQGAWEGTPLFANPTGPFARYCVYQWDADSVGGGEPDEGILLGAVTEIESFDSDCEGVLEQSNAMSAAMGPYVRDIFYDEIGWASPTDLDLEETESERFPVTVAVIDTVPPNAPTPNSRHGEDVAQIIEAIACPAGTLECAVTVNRELGLPRVESGERNMTNGGFYGSQGDLARRIHSVIDAWDSTSSRLVINFSIGWESDLFGGEGFSTVPSEAVREAISRARCAGAAVIAAIGNEGHECNDGPLYPAGWEQVAAPTLAECQAYGINQAPSGTYTPLVYSVTGLSLGNEQMPGTRPAGTSRLAATATHVAAGGQPGLSEPTVLAMTGTSAAAAVASGTAALLWSYEDTLDADAIMAAIYDGGAPMTPSAAVTGPGLSEPDKTIHKINVCGALLEGCTTQGCGAMPLTCDGPLPLSPAEFFAEVALLQTTPYGAPENYTTSTCTNSCGEVDRQSEVPGGVGECMPLPDADSVYITPQPIQAACPNCTLDFSSGVMTGSLDPFYVNDVPTDMWVSIYDGARWTDIQVEGDPLVVGTINSYTVDRIPAGAMAGEVWVYFTPTYARPAVNDLIVQ